MTPTEVVKYMYERDYFSQWMDIKVLDIKENYCLLEMPIKKEMINGLKTVHGGVTFALADSALAFAGNSSGNAGVAQTCSINFMRAGREGDIFRAEAKLENETRKTAVYDIKITNQNGESVAKFVGTLYKIERKVVDL
ncbi:MAG: hotdog fold thioesterase [Weeksellaceae bacterium]